MIDCNEFTIVPDEPQDELPGELIEQEASALIAFYEGALKKTPAFLKSLADHFFGRLDYGKLVSPEMRDTVEFWHNGVPWGITSNFTKNDQTMNIEVSSPINFPYQEVRITLRSGRESAQHTDSPLVQAIGVSESLKQPAVHRNTRNAINIARQLLDFYRK